MKPNPVNHYIFGTLEVDVVWMGVRNDETDLQTVSGTVSVKWIETWLCLPPDAQSYVHINIVTVYINIV